MNRLQADFAPRTLDRAFATLLQQLQPSTDARHAELASLVSASYGHGHACLDLRWLSPDLQQAAASLPWTQGAASPLVCDGRRLYLRRNWVAEQHIRNSIGQRLQQDCPVPGHLATALDLLFTTAADNRGQPDWQKIACALATRRCLTLITGGPGTGKTTTVVRLLALLQSDPARAHKPLRIALAAPTGKAAMRLAESIGGAIARLPPAMQPNLPTEAQTLHKLLQVRSNVTLERLPELALDVLVVDEASMIDLDMMARLLASVPLGARLVLLGDKDQLASVQAGAVMGQLCAEAELGRYTLDTLNWISRYSGQDVRAWGGTGSDLAQQTVMLRQSHRFASDSAIGQWAQAVNAGDLAKIDTLWRQTPAWQAHQACGVHQLPATTLHLADLLRQGWQSWLQVLDSIDPAGCSDAQALAALHAYARFQVLCALREGSAGVLALNQRIARSLGFAVQGWYSGRPVMVTRNDYNLHLMNGDIGLCLPQANGLRVAFANGQGGVRWVLPSRLDAVESVFAMTVHKSQGSEFDHVALVLPDADAAVLTRELLYTGITRAKVQLTLLLSNSASLLRAAQNPVQRSGGLHH